MLVWQVLRFFGVRVLKLCLDIVDVSVHSCLGGSFEVVPLDVDAGKLADFPICGDFI